jgi:hypothetical protein
MGRAGYELAKSKQEGVIYGVVTWIFFSKKKW